MKKLSVGILYGGRSVEHGVSINSARNIFTYIDRKHFRPVAIGIDNKGKWRLTDGVDRRMNKGEPLSLHLDPAKPKLTTKSKSIKLDIIFPVLHGTDGEDGSVQGMLQAMNIPIVGSGVLGSALSMNKIIAKRLLRESGIPVADFKTIHYRDSRPTFEEINKLFGLPFMVKAASLGSSVGVSKVKAKADFEPAVKEAFKFDNEVIFERYIKGREIECAVLGNSPAKASRPGEIIVGKGYEFYTFDAKYVDGEAVTIDVPAKLTEEVSARIRDLSVRAFEALRCEDYARVDLFLTETNEVYVNEINTIPGFTNSSMFPMMWKEQGIGFTDLITRLIRLSVEKTKAKTRVQHDFNSSLKY